MITDSKTVSLDLASSSFYREPKRGLVGLILLINDNFNVVLVGRLVLSCVFSFVLTVCLVLLDIVRVV